MNATVQPYLFFNGNCEEAVEFYKKALGAEVQMMMRYKESPEPPPPGMVPPNYGEKIMHTSFLVGQTVVMASDGCDEGKAAYEGFFAGVNGFNGSRRGPCVQRTRGGGPNQDASHENLLVAQIRDVDR